METENLLLGTIIVLLLASLLTVNYAYVDTEQLENVTLMTNVTASVGSDFYYDIAVGGQETRTVINKFGATLLDTSIHPITRSTHYYTPQTAINLEILSDDVGDTLLGTGARKVTIQGLNASWDEVEIEVNLNGTSAIPLPIGFTRVFRWFVSESGSYANETTGSHLGTITLREAGGGLTWSILTTTPYPIGQSQIGVYSVPRGYDAYLVSKRIFVDSSKTADIYFFKRENINETSAPYTAMRLVEREVGVSGGYGLNLVTPNKVCSTPCDVGFMGVHSVGTAIVSVEFELLLVKQ